VSIAKVMEQYRQLRQELVRHGGDNALRAIEGLALPTRDDDELSFIRLVVWSYALLQENGRVALRFLRELGKMPKGPVNDCVMSLRAWLTHNLSLTSDSDQQRMNIARSWIRATCGRHINLESEHWQQCFNGLCAALSEMLNGALESCAVLDHHVDGPRNVEELRQRLTKNWDAHVFDGYVRESANLLGLDDIDIVAFRLKHLTQWRKVVEVAADGTSHRLLTQRVEGDLLTWFGDALPLTAAEVLKLVPVSPTELSVLLLAVRRRAPVSREDLASALEGLAHELTGLSATRPMACGTSDDDPSAH
jgi:hypothetical protein